MVSVDVKPHVSFLPSSPFRCALAGTHHQNTRASALTKTFTNYPHTLAHVCTNTHTDTVTHTRARAHTHTHTRTRTRTRTHTHSYRLDQDCISVDFNKLYFKCQVSLYLVFLIPFHVHVSHFVPLSLYLVFSFHFMLTYFSHSISCPRVPLRTTQSLSRFLIPFHVDLLLSFHFMYSCHTLYHSVFISFSHSISCLHVPRCSSSFTVLPTGPLKPAPSWLECFLTYPIVTVSVFVGTFSDVPNCHSVRLRWNVF